MKYPQEVTAVSCKMALVQFQQDHKDMMGSQTREVNIIIAVSSLAWNRRFQFLFYLNT